MSDDALNELGTLRKEADALGIKVNPEWTETTLKRKITMMKNGTSAFSGHGDHDGNGEDGGAKSPEPEAAAPPIPKKTAEAKLVSVNLVRNYRPMGYFEVVGHHKPAVKVRNVAGKEVEVEPAAFIPSEVAPAPQAGVGFATKIWAGTVIRLETDEAKYVRSHGIGEIEID